MASRRLKGFADMILSEICQTLCSHLFQTPKGVQLLESESRMNSGCLGLGGGEKLNLLQFEKMKSVLEMDGSGGCLWTVHSKIVKTVNFIVVCFPK